MEEKQIKKLSEHYNFGIEELTTLDDFYQEESNSFGEYKPEVVERVIANSQSISFIESAFLGEETENFDYDTSNDYSVLFIHKKGAKKFLMVELKPYTELKKPYTLIISKSKQNVKAVLIENQLYLLFKDEKVSWFDDKKQYHCYSIDYIDNDIIRKAYKDLWMK